MSEKKDKEKEAKDTKDESRDDVTREKKVNAAVAAIEKSYGKGAIMRLSEEAVVKGLMLSARAHYPLIWRWAWADCRADG